MSLLILAFLTGAATGAVCAGTDANGFDPDMGPVPDDESWQCCSCGATEAPDGLEQS